METYPIVKIVFDRRKKSSPTVKGAVEIEIYFLRRRKWISTGIKIYPQNWNIRKEAVVGTIDSNDLNLRINGIKKAIDSFINKHILEGKPFSWAMLDLFLKNNREKDSFITFVGNQINNRNDISAGTRRNHLKFHKALQDFKIICEFEDLTKQNIQRYDEWLHSRKQCCQTTVASYHKYMKVYINRALQLELISKNPYDGIKIESGKSARRKYLTESELSKIESYTPSTESLVKVRDLFIFQTYTGLSFADLKKFDYRTITERNGKFILQDQRQKTGEDYYIVLLPPALDILKKYGYVLPLMSLEQYNMRLKIIADGAGIEKRLTSHMARHTYATLCLNKGIKIEILAKMLGHSDIRTTQIYAKLVDASLECAYDHLQKELFDNTLTD